MLRVSALKKQYRSGSQTISAVDGVSFDLPEQDFAAIVGPSGAGKSTVLHILGGLEPPTSGQVLHNGKDIYRFGDHDLSRWRNRTVGFVFQFYHLIEELNVLDNVTVSCLRGGRKYALKKGRSVLQYLGIENRAGFFPSQLSGGEKQKVALARTLMNDPDMILCDEPTGSLDKDSQEKVMSLLEELNAKLKKTIVLVTHNMDLADRAKRIIFFENGKVAKIREN